MKRLLEGWVAMWSLTEHPRSLALVRILLGIVVLGDFLIIAGLGLVEPLFAPQEAGGFPDILSRAQLPRLYQWLPPTASTAWLIWGAVVVSTLCFTLGLFSRLSAVALLLLSAQVAQILPSGDRGIDLLIRNVLLMMAFSECGACWSIDARLRTGRWEGDGHTIPAWPRHLLILQLVVMYFMAGVQKAALSWTPLGGLSALYIVLHDPSFARTDFAWLDRIYPVTQLATLSTMAFEWGAPVVLWAFYCRWTADRPGKLRAFTVRYHLHLWWLGVGVMLHLGIALTMRLGIFPWAMLATYPALLHPDELLAFWRRLTGPFRRDGGQLESGDVAGGSARG